MSTRGPTSDALTELVAQRLRVLGQPLRVKLIDSLRDGAATVQQLVEAIDGVQQNVSQHLAILHRAGIVSRRKDGIRVWYELADPHVPQLLDEARASVTRQLGELSRLIQL
jgi:DNA-binding transcriptional ArsR family regulator